jgi:nucleoside-diphosphate-sugar epimerase
VFGLLRGARSAADAVLHWRLALTDPQDMTDGRGLGRTAAITGASGYLGSRLAERFAERGWDVVRLVRSAPPDDGSARHYDLAEDVGPGLLASVDVLVHAAYDLAATRREEIWRVNVEGSRRLFAVASLAGGCRIIAISSMSAYEGTSQIYGRAKLAIESAALDAGGCAVRPGLVYGDRSGGMAGALERLCRLPVIPLVGGDARQYPVREADVVGAVIALAEADDFRPEVVGAAPADPVTFRALLETFADRQGRRAHFVPVPWQLLYWSLRFAELCRVSVPFRADSLLGLVRPAPCVPGIERLSQLGIHPGPPARTPA